MDETSMIERVARAIAERAGVIWGGPRGVDDPDFLLPRMVYMAMAEAAIEAMREPTDDMRIPSYIDNVNWPMRRQIYRDMIGAALSQAIGNKESGAD